MRSCPGSTSSSTRIADRQIWKGARAWSKGPSWKDGAARKSGRRFESCPFRAYPGSAGDGFAFVA